MRGKSIAPRRNGQPVDKVALDFGIGARAEVAFWKTLPWTSTKGPDLEAYEDRNRCSFGPDVGDWQVKSASKYGGDLSFVFEKAHLARNPTGWVAFMEDAGGRYRLKWVLDYPAVQANTMPMKKASLRATKCAVYDSLLVPSYQLSLLQLEEHLSR